MRRAADVHDFLRAARNLSIRFGNEAFRPCLARAFDLGDAIAAGAFGFLQYARIGFRQPLLVKSVPGFGTSLFGR